MAFLQATPTDSPDSCLTFATIMEKQPNNPLHGKTLQMILEHLLEIYGWNGLAYHININCFKNEPSIGSSLKFLRKTPWAREEVEALYLRTQKAS